jgi:3-hydroxybutyryl-CoA dehydrogenase
MNILVVGTATESDEVQRKFGSNHHYQWVSRHEAVRAGLAEADVVFDFLWAETPEPTGVYLSSTRPIFIHAVNRALLELAGGNRSMPWFGFNGWPTCVERSLLEVSCLNEIHQPLLAKICAELGTDFRVVDDRVGLVTPRVIATIVNEAFFTVQEGTATRADIDKAMQLGTNYPFGPFAWCERIGLGRIYRLLDALYHDTHDERYKIAPLLKKEFLQSLNKTT